MAPHMNETNRSNDWLAKIICSLFDEKMLDLCYETVKPGTIMNAHAAVEDDEIKGRLTEVAPG